MLKEHEKNIVIYQRIVDSMILSAAWAVSYYLRFEYLEGGQKGLQTFFFQLSPILIIISQYFYSKNRLYESQRFSSRFKEIWSTLVANFQTFITFVILLYFFSPERVSRMTLLIYLGTASVFALVGRITFRNGLRVLRKNGRNLRHIILIGDGKQLLKYIDTIKRFKDSGIKISAWINSEGMALKSGIPEFQNNLEQAKLHVSPDAIIIGFSNKNLYKSEEIFNKYYNDVTPFQVLPDIDYSLIGHKVEDFEGIPIITLNAANMNNFELFLKRTLDLIGSILGGLFIFPLLSLIAILIKLTSKGPILYGQKRMGIDGKTFKMWKFRSMRVGAEKATGAVWAKENDNRKTPIGNFLRKTSLDELPQLFNVLTGDMSLVGPRPERPIFVEKFRHEIPAYMLRHKMKAGMTGWAQVSGWRGDTSLEKRIEFDLYYIKNWSFVFDIKILFLTILRGFINKNAY